MIVGFNQKYYNLKGEGKHEAKRMIIENYYSQKI